MSIMTRYQKVGYLYRKMTLSVDSYRHEHGNYPNFKELIFLMEQAAGTAPFSFDWSVYRAAKMKAMEHCIAVMKGAL